MYSAAAPVLNLSVHRVILVLYIYEWEHLYTQLGVMIRSTN